MAVTITAPQSGYFDRTGAITVSWTNSITAPPQTAYEIMYKLKTASSWSTLGKVTSTATSANLKPIYDAVSQDAVEFYYKVVVYHDLATLSSGNKEGGIEHSAVYSIMFHGSQIATLKVQETASSTQTYPLFNGSTTPTAKLNVRTTSSATGTAPLVASGHPLAGRGKVITASGYTAFIGGSSPTFAASGQVRYGYFYGYRYQYSFSYYNRANYTYAYYTSIVGLFHYVPYYRVNHYLYYLSGYTNNYSAYTIVNNIWSFYSVNYQNYYMQYHGTNGNVTSPAPVGSTPAAVTYTWPRSTYMLYAYRNIYAYYISGYGYSPQTNFYYYARFTLYYIGYYTIRYSGATAYNTANYTRQYYAYRAGGTYTYGVYRRLNTSYPVWYYARPLISYRTSYTYYYKVYLYATYYRYTYYWYTAYYNVPGGGRAGRTFYRYAYGRRNFYGNSSAQTGYTTRYYYTTQTFYYISYSYSNVYYGYWPNSYQFYNYISSYTRRYYYTVTYNPIWVYSYYYQLANYRYYPLYSIKTAYLSYRYAYYAGYGYYNMYHALTYTTSNVAHTGQTAYWNYVNGAVSYRAYTWYTTYKLGYSIGGGYAVKHQYWTSEAYTSYSWHPMIYYYSRYTVYYISGYYNTYGYYISSRPPVYRQYSLYYFNNEYYQYYSAYGYANAYAVLVYRNHSYAYIYSYTPTYHYTNDLSYNYQYYTR